MARGDAYDVSDSYVRSDDVAGVEPSDRLARKRSAIFFNRAGIAAPAARYGAFISYSHAASGEVARGLQKWLQIYAKPWWRWRAINVFRDETNLTAAPALWSRIADALDQSSHFILLASPEAAQSKWIKREIRYWLGDRHAGALDGPDLDAPVANPRPERIATLLIALTAGDISWDEKAKKSGDFDWSKTNAVPRQLSGVFRENRNGSTLEKSSNGKSCAPAFRAAIRSSCALWPNSPRRSAASPISAASLARTTVNIDGRSEPHGRQPACSHVFPRPLYGSGAPQWPNAPKPKLTRSRQRPTPRRPRQTPRRPMRTPAGQTATRRRQRLMLTRRMPICAKRRSGSRGFWPIEPGKNEQAAMPEPRSSSRLKLCPTTPPGLIDRTSPRRSCSSIALGDLRERLDLVHESGVSNAAFSPDGKLIVTASLDRMARLWDAVTGRPIGPPLRGHADAVRRAAFSPDGQRIVTASDDTTARIWDAAGKPIGDPLYGHKKEVYGVAFSPDGQRIVTASWDKTARIWDAAGKPIGEPLKGHEREVYTAAFSPDGKRIITASWDGTARIWDAASGKPIGKPLVGHDNAVYSAAFSPDGQRIVTASEDKTVRIWDAETGRPIGEPLKGHDNAVWSASFSPDGRLIVTASEDKTARLWDAATGKPIGEPLKRSRQLCLECGVHRRR